MMSGTIQPCVSNVEEELGLSYDSLPTSLEEDEVHYELVQCHSEKCLP